jgi:hypothetical protein
MPSMRKFIFAVVLMLAIIFILARTAELSSIVETIRQADWRFVLIALLLIIAWVGNTSLSFLVIYRAMGMEERYIHLALTVSAANFVNIVAPSGGVGGIAVLISEAKRKGISQARVTVAGAVVVLLDYIAFLAVLAGGLIVLIRRSTLSNTELGASILMVILVLVIGSFLYLGMRSASALGKTLEKMAHLANRVMFPFLHREYFAEYHAYEFAHDAAEGLHHLRRNPKSLVVPAILALSGKLLLVLIFLVVFLAYKVPFSPGTIIAGWSLSYLFTIISPTPGGMGVVEGLLPLSLTTLNVSLGAATVIMLTYRGVTFWLPLLFGMFAFRWLVREEEARVSV